MAELLQQATWHTWLTLAVVAGATVTMAREKLGPDLVMFAALSILVVAGVVGPEDALSGFARPEVATIGVLFVCAAAMQETGALRFFASVVLGDAKRPTPLLLRLTAPTAMASAFLNNTPIVAMLVPVVRSHAKRVGISSSRLLIPLAWASMFGGTCTLIGTSANLVVSGMLAQSGRAEMGMLEIAWVGIPTTLVGLAYLLLVGQRLLPKRRDTREAFTEDAREYLVELAVDGASPLVGQTVQEAGLRQLPGLFLAEIRRRNGLIVAPVAPPDAIEEGDHLVFTGVASTVEDLLGEFPGLHPVDERVSMAEKRIYEVVISHRSELVGRSVRDLEFRRRFDAAILAIHRAGERLNQKIGEVVLEPGDTLMLSASPGFRLAWQNSPNFYLVSEVRTNPEPRYGRARLATAVVLALVLIPATTGLPMLVSAMGALVVLVATGCIGLRGARAAVNWSVLVLIGSAFGVARALELSGAAGLLGNLLVDLTGAFGPRATLAGVYVAGVVFASFISNSAAAALVFPIAMTAADSGGFDARPFAMALALAASAGFSTPIGCQPNLLVYGPGGYRYLDFTRAGLPLNGLLLGMTLALVPVIWPF